LINIHLKESINEDFDKIIMQGLSTMIYASVPNFASIFSQLSPLGELQVRWDCEFLFIFKSMSYSMDDNTG